MICFYYQIKDKEMMTYDKIREIREAALIGATNLFNHQKMKQRFLYERRLHVLRSVYLCVLVHVSFGRQSQEAVTLHPDNNLVL